MAPQIKRKSADPTYKHGHVAHALAASRPSVDSGMLLADLIEVWGGTKELARDLKREFDKAAGGGMTRQRILEMIQRLIITNTTNEIGKPSDPSDLTDDELQAELKLFVARINDAAPADPGP